ncbi:hypothetical protein [Burkholderia ubonensis]|uniref:hypothetical protein n=1 Tax=Burkholderia ubonensis TaxID=101571 RepID=UPI0012FCD618|nr:hypothetical protein [Burkholderia ubonensis]
MASSLPGHVLQVANSTAERTSGSATRPTSHPLFCRIQARLRSLSNAIAQVGTCLRSCNDVKERNFEVTSPPLARTAINSLPSGPKIDLAVSPGVTIDALDEVQQGHLSRALGHAPSNDLAAQTAAVKGQLQALAGELSEGIWLDEQLRNFEFLDKQLPGLFKSLSADEKNALEGAMNVAHIAIRPRLDPTTGRYCLRVFFGGMQSARDFHQNVRGAIGSTGKVDRAAQLAGRLFAKMLDCKNERCNAELDFVGGASMGGAMAQIFLATVQSRATLPKPPAMILLDPLLPNDKQAKRAIGDGTYPVDFSEPRGIALSLDYSSAPRKSLMSIQKGLGRNNPGLVRLKLGLTDTDGIDKNGNRRPPRAYSPLGAMGYHGDAILYAHALARFAGQDDPPAQAVEN